MCKQRYLHIRKYLSCKAGLPNFARQAPYISGLLSRSCDRGEGKKKEEKLEKMLVTHEIDDKSNYVYWSKQGQRGMLRR